MLQQKRLSIAIQKKGRLNNDSIELLSRCGIKFYATKNSLIVRSINFPIDILYVRDDDIPTLVMDGICDLGIVGENVLCEKKLYQQNNGFESRFILVKKLGFGRCRLSIAIPNEVNYSGLTSLNSLKIATSYPNLLQQYLDKNKISSQLLLLNGSVEIAPRLGMADAICDLVSTGKTLEENNLFEVATLIKSQAVLIQSQSTICNDKEEIKNILFNRIYGVLKAQESKYISFHAPKSQLASIKKILPGCESPSVIPLEGNDDKVAVHVVSPENIFWETLEKLKKGGASSILVLPIEKIMN